MKCDICGGNHTTLEHIEGRACAPSYAALQAQLAQERAKVAGLEKELSNARTGEAEQPRPTLAAIVRTLHREVLKSRDETDALRIERDDARAALSAAGIGAQSGTLAERIAILVQCVENTEDQLSNEAVAGEVLTKTTVKLGEANENLRATLAATPSSTEPRPDAPAP